VRPLSSSNGATVSSPLRRTRPFDRIANSQDELELAAPNAPPVPFAHEPLPAPSRPAPLTHPFRSHAGRNRPKPDNSAPAPHTCTRRRRAGPTRTRLTRFAFACNPRTAAAAHEPARAQPHPIRIPPPPPRTASLARGRGQVHAGHTRPPRRVDPGREPRIKSGCGQPSYKRPSPPAHRRGAPTPPQPSSRTPSRPPPIDRRNPPRNPTAAAAARPGAFERRCLETERRTRSRRRAAPTSTSRSKGRYARRRSPPLISFLLGRIASVFALVAIVAMQVVA
jgi:hypothetical protein